MNIKADHHRTISAFLNLKDVWLLGESNLIMVIRDVQYTHTKPKPETDDEVLPVNTRKYRRRKEKAEARAKLLEEFRITELKIEGYHSDGKFIGTFNDDFCERMVRKQDDKYNSFDVYALRKRWEDILAQKEAFMAHEIKLENRAKESKEHSEDNEIK